ncbi:acetyl-CoA synthetase-like protein [Stipitochalara longipes BDJ]|nr:acetyl-CoA synthetase-like protein [Stipitochalara longipes BDJ]
MATESSFPPVVIPEIDIWEFLFERERDFPDERVIFTQPNVPRQYRFVDVKNTGAAFGHALRSLWKWQKGDVLGFYSPNCVDTPALHFGTFWAGGLASPANPTYSIAELAFQLKNSGAKGLVTQAFCLDKALEAAKIVGIPRNRILLIGNETHSEVMHFIDFLSDARFQDPTDRVVNFPGDAACILYSSGTTGLPKGVQTTHRNTVFNLLAYQEVQANLSSKVGSDGRGDTIISVLPFFHAFGLILGMTHALMIGCKAIVMPSFDLEAYCRTIQEHRVTFLYMVPPIVLALSKSPVVDKYDLSSVKMGVAGAAPVAHELVDALWNRLKIPVKQGYGMTELTVITFLQKPEDWRSKIGSIGNLLPNMSAKIMSESGTLMPIGESGEIWIKGPHVCAGYLNNPTATENMMTPDGFLKTGDIGYQNRDGDFYITDRLKELIKYKGLQVAPAELEGILVSHDKLADACVLGVYDADRATELPRAYVVKAASGREMEDLVLEKEIQEWINTKVANHKQLRGGIRFIDVIPKSASGKILRRIVRDKMRAEELKKEVGKSKL